MLNLIVNRIFACQADVPNRSGMPYLNHPDSCLVSKMLTITLNLGGITCITCRSPFPLQVDHMSHCDSNILFDADTQPTHLGRRSSSTSILFQLTITDIVHVPPRDTAQITPVLTRPADKSKSPYASSLTKSSAVE